MNDTNVQAVREVVEQYVKGTYQADVELLRSCFHPKAVMNGYLVEQCVLATPEPFFQDVGSKPSFSSTNSPYRGEIVAIDVVGNVANVILKETGFGGMAFTNYFHLIREDQAWTIISKTFTTELVCLVKIL